MHPFFSEAIKLEIWVKKTSIQRYDASFFTLFSSSSTFLLVYIRTKAMWQYLITSYYRYLIDSLPTLLTLFHVWFIASYSLYPMPFGNK